MQDPAGTKNITPKEYLAIEREAEYKSEYYNGEMFGMSGASFRHNVINVNILVALSNQLKGKPCRAYASDLRTKPAKLEYYTYPDISVICGKPEFDDEAVKDTVTNPSMLIEVLSPLTKNYDRGEKFEFYRTMDSLKEYLLVDQSKIHVEHFHITPEGFWLLKDYMNMSDCLALESIGCELKLADIYENVEF